MSGELAIDPGPLARLEAVKTDVNTPTVVFQRVAEGETLKKIAKAWQIPVGPFVEWFLVEHALLYDAALKVRADDLAHEALEVADEQCEVEKENGQKYDPEVPRDKLRVETRLKLAAHWDRSRYGTAKDVGSGGVTVLVDRTCGGSVEVKSGGASAKIELDSPEASRGVVIEPEAA